MTLSNSKASILNFSSFSNKSNMEYSVRSINTARNHNTDRSEFSRQLQTMINEHAEEGWELHGVEQVSTWVKGNSACFNQKQGYFETINLVIFKR